MKKKTNIKTVIRQIVREEVAMAIQEVITELKQPSLSSQPKPKKKIVEKKSFTKNSILNDVLNETAQDGDWKTVGGSKFTSERMNELVGKNYSDIMNDDGDSSNGNLATSMGVNPNNPEAQFLKKDYRDLMKAIDKKQGK